MHSKNIQDRLSDVKILNYMTSTKFEQCFEQNRTHDAEGTSGGCYNEAY